MKDLPEADVFVIENYVKMPNNVNIAGANLFYVKLQILAMLIALINSNKIAYSPNHVRKYLTLFEFNAFETLNLTIFYRKICKQSDTNEGPSARQVI